MPDQILPPQELPRRDMAADAACTRALNAIRDVVALADTLTWLEQQNPQPDQTRLESLSATRAKAAAARDSMDLNDTAAMTQIAADFEALAEQLRAQLP